NAGIITRFCAGHTEAIWIGPVVSSRDDFVQPAPAASDGADQPEASFWPLWPDLFSRQAMRQEGRRVDGSGELAAKRQTTRPTYEKQRLASHRTRASAFRNLSNLPAAEKRTRFRAPPNEFQVVSTRQRKGTSVLGPSHTQEGAWP